MWNLSLEDLDVHPDGPEAGWSATLAADGVPLVDVERGPDGGFVVSEGPDAQDDVMILAVLEDSVASEGGVVPASDGGARPETLADRVAELVAVGWIVERTSRELERSAMAVVEGALVEVRVPEDGTLEEAAAHLRTAHSGALILNDMDPAEAALERTRHA